MHVTQNGGRGCLRRRQHARRYRRSRITLDDQLNDTPASLSKPARYIYRATPLMLLLSFLDHSSSKAHFYNSFFRPHLEVGKTTRCSNVKMAISLSSKHAYFAVYWHALYRMLAFPSWARRQLNLPWPYLHTNALTYEHVACIYA